MARWPCCCCCHGIYHLIIHWLLLTKSAILVHQYIVDHVIICSSLLWQFKYPTYKDRQCDSQTMCLAHQQCGPKRGKRILKCRLVHTAVTQQATGPVVCDWPRSPGEKRKKGCQICPTSRKLGRENRYLNLDHLYLKTSMLGYFDYIYTSQYFLTYFSGDYVRKSLIRHYR